MANPKMPRRLVALSSSAIAAIYFAGLISTHGADATIATPIVVTTAAPTATATGTYKDGSYAGTGTSRRGNVTVTVTVAGGRITNVALTSVNTEYPASRIAALPAQVVARQNASVDNVTGATYSAQAFRLAVQAALAKATA